MPLVNIRRSPAASLPTLVSSLRSLSNPYHATLNKGAAAFAKSVGAEYVTLVTESNSEKALADIKAILSKTDGNCVIDVDPNDTPDARAIVEVCKKAGAYVLTMWNKPDDLHPWDNNPNYVAHISFSGVASGKATGEALIKAMGGKGGIVAIGGSQSATAGIERKKGLDAALAANPGVQLLDYQIANWSANEAIDKMNAWLTKFGDQIGGVWAANDDMALAAVEALRADGRAGKVPVTGLDATQLAVEAIQKGEMVGTVSFEPYWHGGIALAIGLAAKTGKFDPAKEPKEHREFYGTGPVVTAANADEFYQNNFLAEPKFDWNDLWGRVSGQITYE
ncbi:sugar ABC transporter substrate-binding protein [Mesorhizobium sp. XAP10]|uniref:sugar ABC transporter substrate-binding protein n=1 Tax=unclassified Mesorhizobium TaxID=325217 RepID=UPI0023DFE087|nr:MULTISPECIES: sugar ABC transporter substrate-binding protein [unclassified Mesorhizobium]MDF3154549.1 sugar ABC transporter substrate-binding protein [Mesorhizobium sp. XAP10]MDF3247901.1 sugar ABC transporter substrate-binding protein [Mesorhizobium sp. XAP4]